MEFNQTILPSSRQLPLKASTRKELTGELRLAKTAVGTLGESPVCPVGPKNMKAKKQQLGEERNGPA